jgi:hypothetical protein
MLTATTVSCLVALRSVLSGQEAAMVEAGMIAGFSGDRGL